MVRKLGQIGYEAAHLRGRNFPKTQVFGAEDETVPETPGKTGNKKTGYLLEGYPVYGESASFRCIPSYRLGS